MSIQRVSALTVPEGDGVTVKRLMPLAGMRNFDPFVLWDHFDIAGGGFPDHPHRGFEAITYLFAGGMNHADNLGNVGTVYAGGAQRFTAGRGIVHSEMPDGHAAGIQLWINLPRRLKGIDPAYQQVEKAAITTESGDGVSIAHIVGEKGAIRLQTKVEYLEVRLDAGAVFSRSLPSGWRGLIYVVSGAISCGELSAQAGDALLVDAETALTISADSAAHLMWCMGEPLGEPIFQRGPFVD